MDSKSVQEMDDVKIYIAEQRGEILRDKACIRSTFNYEGYSDAHRLPYDALLHVNEWSAAGDQELQIPVQKDTMTILLPMQDGLIVTVDGRPSIVAVGNIFVWKAAGSAVIRVRGLQDVAYFQHLVLQCPVSPDQAGASAYPLPILEAEAKNKMLALFDPTVQPIQLYFGAFLGKSDFLLDAERSFSHFFAYALEGNFEIEGRILFTGDALSLTDFTKLDIECLSATGLLLLLHF